MISALLTVGVLGLSVGCALGLGIGGILASEKTRKALAQRDHMRDALTRQSYELTRAHQERAAYQHRAAVAESWLPDLIVQDIATEETAR